MDMSATVTTQRERRLRLFLAHRDSLARYILSLVRDSHDAEDLAQELASIVLSAVGSPDAPDPFAAWCRGIARKLALKHLSKRRNQPTFVELKFFDTVEKCEGDLSSNAEIWAQRRQALVECLEALPPTAHSVLVFRYGGGESSQQIAARVGQTPEAVRMLLYRIRHRLANCIASRMKRKSNP